MNPIGDRGLFTTWQKNRPLFCGKTKLIRELFYNVANPDLS